MRIYTNAFDAVRETERDLWEMGIRTQPQSMQDKNVSDDKDYETIELQGYGFKISRDLGVTRTQIYEVVSYLFKQKGHEEVKAVVDFIYAEFDDRMLGFADNPGQAWKTRRSVWEEFLHEGKFAYTYSERFNERHHSVNGGEIGQVANVVHELCIRPGTRQAIISMHQGPREMESMGGSARVPCSMYYQFLLRDNRLHLIYTMRSCDLLTHFPVDLMLTMKMQDEIAQRIATRTGESIALGDFTYFCGSLHAYEKDIKAREVF